MIPEDFFGSLKISYADMYYIKCILNGKKVSNKNVSKHIPPPPKQKINKNCLQGL